jgi:2,4-dienoyl-CoA reductase-like NADH-dependent reductase (Old Yellow Enzyme family)
VSLAFAPTRLGSLPLRNRVIKTAAFEGMCPGGMPTKALQEQQRRLAQGGVAMTTVAYCSVSADGRSYPTQIWMRPEIVPQLGSLCAAVHGEGAAASIQLGHCGYFANKHVVGGRPLGPSKIFNTYGLTFAQPMTEEHIARVIEDFAKAAQLAREAGFDAIELHAGHGYLLSQFLSPYTNRRRDRWGETLENRARLTFEVLRATRGAVGSDMPILVKINMRDGFSAGLQLDEALKLARWLEAAGADALVLSGGFVSKTPFYMLRGDVPVKPMVKVQKSWHIKLGLTLFGRLLVQRYAYQPAFFRDDARAFRAAVRMPLVMVGGLNSRAIIEEVLAEGFDLVALGRPLIYDPDFVLKLERGELDTSGCEPCNECIAEMDRGGVRCVRADSPTNAESR